MDVEHTHVQWMHRLVVCLGLML